MMNKYIVLQGYIDKYGGGVLEPEKTFTNKQEAIKYFNKIKRDVEGWLGDYLVTAIREVSDECNYIAYHEEPLKKY